MTPTITSTCDVCGRNLVLPNGVEIVGTLISLDMQKDSPFTKECEAMMSPYEPGREYKICFPCMLKSLGVKPATPEVAWANYTSGYTAITNEDLVRRMRKAVKSMVFSTPKASVPERKNPFVTEVTRIIRKGMPRRYGQRTVILASERFYREAKEELCRQNEILGRDIVPSESETIRLREALLLPAPWLSDYEFEIRPPV